MKIQIGNISFTQNEKHHLVMTAEQGAQTYALEFLDCVTLGVTIPGRCSTICTKESLGENTRFTTGENTLLAVTEIEPGVKICNRFTVGESVEMDTWVEAERRFMMPRS